MVDIVDPILPSKQKNWPCIMPWVNAERLNIFSPSVDLQIPQSPKAIDDANTSCAFAGRSWNAATNPHQNNRGSNVTKCH